MFKHIAAALLGSATPAVCSTPTIGVIAINVGVPARLLHLRAQQLHEGAPARADRGRAGGRRRRVAAVLAASSCRCAGRRSPRSARWRSSGSTTTSSGRCCSSRAATGCRSPPALNNLQGQFLANYNLLAAGAMITAVPTLIIYLAAAAPVRRRAHPRRQQGMTVDNRANNSLRGLMRGTPRLRRLRRAGLRRRLQPGAVARGGLGRGRRG